MTTKLVRLSAFLPLLLLAWHTLAQPDDEDYYRGRLFLTRFVTCPRGVGPKPRRCDAIQATCILPCPVPGFEDARCTLLDCAAPVLTTRGDPPTDEPINNDPCTPVYTNTIDDGVIKRCLNL